MNSMDKRSVSLSEAAREIGANTSYEVLRRAVNRLGAGRKDERGRITISSALVKAFKAERKRSGYLHPRGAETRRPNRARRSKFPMPPDRGTVRLSSQDRHHVHKHLGSRLRPHRHKQKPP